jgi:hypothetical protein
VNRKWGELWPKTSFVNHDNAPIDIELSVKVYDKENLMLEWKILFVRFISPVTCSSFQNYSPLCRNKVSGNRMVSRKCDIRAEVVL